MMTSLCRLLDDSIYISLKYEKKNQKEPRKRNDDANSPLLNGLPLSNRFLFCVKLTSPNVINYREGE